MPPDHDPVAHRKAFDRDQAETLSGLAGAMLQSILISEWALYGGEDDEPAVFHHPDLGFVQAGLAMLSFADGRKLEIGIYQDDDRFALHFERRERAVSFQDMQAADCAISRCRMLDDFPRGPIQTLDPRQDEAGAIQELWVHFAERTMIFKAGEVEEGWGGRLTVRDHDESVLIFRDEQSYLATIFNQPVYTIP